MIAQFGSQLHAATQAGGARSGTPPSAQATGSFRASQSWNDLGLVGVLNYPARCTGSNCSMPDQRTVNDTYMNGFLRGVTNFASSITYQPNGLIDTLTHANSVRESWIPDPSGLTRPCAIFTYGSGVSLASNTGGSYPACSHSLTGGNAGAARFGSGEYAYDASGNVKAIGSKSYTYDGVSRYTASNSGESVVYDAFGNITSHTGQAGNVDSSTNRLTTATYDDAGNVTALNADTSSQSATWDALSMMQSFRIYAKGGPHPISGPLLRNASYVYDPDDERIAVIDNPAGDFVSSGRSVATYTLRAFDPHLLRSYTDDPRPLDNPQPPNSELWTLKEDEIWRGSQLLALVTGDGYTAHYTLDHLGSPATLTDCWRGRQERDHRPAASRGTVWPRPVGKNDNLDLQGRGWAQPINAFLRERRHRASRRNQGDAAMALVDR